MADQKQVKLLTHSVKKWNQWREKNCRVIPNLEGADLRETDLRGADLERADLCKANLERAALLAANLERAALLAANLGETDLRGADLERADLCKANFEGADLLAANFEGADLWGANLRGAENIPDAYINLCMQNLYYILLHTRSEIPYLREKLIEGKINGTLFENDCVCLIGSPAKGLPKNGDRIEKTCSHIPFYKKGLHNYGEQLFWQIREGDTPKNSFWAQKALEVIAMVEGKT